MTIAESKTSVEVPAADAVRTTASRYGPSYMERPHDDGALAGGR